jgi:hypothetical protein
LIKEFKEKKMEFVHKNNIMSSKVKNRRISRIYKNLLLLGDYKDTWTRTFKNTLNKLLLKEIGKDIHKIDHTKVYFYDMEVFVDSEKYKLSDQFGVWTAQDNNIIKQFINEFRETVTYLFNETNSLQLFDRVPCKVFLEDLDEFIHIGTYPF